MAERNLLANGELLAKSVGAAANAPLDLEQLVADYSLPLYRYAYRLSGSAPDAEDLVQHVFLVAQQKLAQLREAECVRSWLYTILRRAYLKQAAERAPLPAADLGESFDINYIPQQVNESPLDPELLELALAELAPEFKIVVLMFYFEHRSYKEIAEALDLPAGTVMSRLSRAKNHLRRRLLVDEELASGEPAKGEPASPDNNKLEVKQPEATSSAVVHKPTDVVKPEITFPPRAIRAGK